MEKVPLGWHSRGYLPHFDGGEIAQFITLRLGDSVPLNVIERWNQELLRQSQKKREAVLRRRMEAFIDMGYGECYLRNTQIASLVEDSLLHFDRVRYRLSAWVVMPNHIHFLFIPSAGWELSSILHSIKSFTAQRANRILGKKGEFWQEDYFDRFIRDHHHFSTAVAYIENNPIKARLCKKPEDWRFSSARRRIGNQ